MSWEIQAWAEDMAEIFNMSASKAGVLYLLARRCDENASCYPSLEHIKMSSRVKRTAALEALKSLTEDGLIGVENRKCPGAGRCGRDGCRGGHNLGNRYYLQMEYGEQFIAEAIMQGRVLPSGRHKSRAKYLAAAKRVFDDQVQETPGQMPSPGDGPWTSEPVEKQGPGDEPWTKTPGQVPGPGDGPWSSRVRETDEQGPGDGPYARGLVDRAPVSNFQSNFQYSSSPETGELRPREDEEPTATAAGGEEEPLRGADLHETQSRRPSAASGDVHGDGAHQHPKAERPVNLPEVTRALREIPAIRSWFTGRPDTTSLLTGWVDQVLDRASDPVIGQPTGMVIAAARRNPTRTREELNRLANPVSVQTTSERPRPKKCPIPAHAALGHHQANCPECRDLTGEGNFPAAIDTGIYAELSEAGRKNIDRYRVPVHRHVDHEELLRTLSWAERRRAA